MTHRVVAAHMHDSAVDRGEDGLKNKRDLICHVCGHVDYLPQQCPEAADDVLVLECLRKMNEWRFDFDCKAHGGFIGFDGLNPLGMFGCGCSAPTHFLPHMQMSQVRFSSTLGGTSDQEEADPPRANWRNDFSHWAQEDLGDGGGNRGEGNLGYSG